MTQNNNIDARRCHNAGFSLIEIIFYIFLLVVPLILYASSLNLIRLLKSTRYQNIAYHIAITQMENLRRMPFESLPPSGSFSNSDFVLIPSGSGNTTVTSIGANLKQVSVGVSWIESSTTKNVTLTTLIYANGLNTL